MTNFKKLLLAGTAVVAVSAFAPATQAADLTLAADGTWASAGGANSTPTTDITNAAAGDNVSVTSDATITITNNGVADDGSANTNTFALGDVTDTATANIAITPGSDNNLTVTIDSVNIAGNVTVTGNADAGNDGIISVTLDDAAVASVIGGNLVLDNSAVDGVGNTLTFDADGELTVTGTTAVTAGAAAGDSSATLIASKDATFTGAVTITGGANAASIATGLFQGSTTFTGGVTLDDGAAGAAVATFDVATDGTDLTVAGDIVGAADGEGTVNVVDDDRTTEDSVTFSGTLGTAAASLAAVNVGVGEGADAVFNGDVDATAITVGAAGNGAENTSADFNGDVTGALTAVASIGAGNTVVNLAGDLTGTLALTDVAGNGTATAIFDGTSAQTVSGAVTPTNQEGIINVTGTGGTTFESAIGAGVAGLGLFTVGSGSMATLEADLFTDSTNNAAAAGLDVDGTLVLTNSAGAGIDVLEDAGDIDVDGTLTVNGDTTSATIEATTGDIYIDGTFTTAIGTAGQTTTLTSGTATVIGATSDTTVSAGNQIVLGSDLTFGASGRTTTVEAVNSATFDIDANDVIDAGGNVVTHTASSVTNYTIGDASSALADGATINFIENATGSDLDGDLAAGTAVLLDTALVDLVDNASDNDTLSATVDILDATTVIGSEFDGAAEALLGDTTVTGALLAERGDLMAAATSTAARSIAEGLSPTVDGSVQSGVVSTVTNSALGITGERLAALRHGDETGMAAGNMTHGLKTWGQVFGATGEQDARDGVSGYDVDTWGVSVGIDTQTLAEDWVWGLAFTYANTDTDSANSTNTQVDLDTYQIALYGDYKWDAATYVNGQIGYAMNNGDQTRTIAADAGGTTTASADTDSDVFFVRLETGRDFDMDNGWTLTPIALLNYQHINSDGYTESCAAASTACLSGVDVDNMNILEAGLGGEASYLHQNADGSFLKPRLHAAYRYDFIGDEVETTSSFSGQAGTTFTTQGFDAQQSTFNVGAGLEFFTTANWELSVNYDYEIKEDYDAHNGYVRAAYKF